MLLHQTFDYSKTFLLMRIFQQDILILLVLFVDIGISCLKFSKIQKEWGKICLSLDSGITIGGLILKVWDEN